LETARCAAPHVLCLLLTIGPVTKNGLGTCEREYKESTLMAIADRFIIKVVASAGLCGAAIALSPTAAAVPFMTGGHACIEGQAGDLAPLPAAGGVGAAGAPAAAGACAAPLTDMAGIPMAVPGPLPVVPMGAPLPVVPLAPPVPVVPVGAPLIALPGAPLAVGAPLEPVIGAPLIDMAGVKDAPVGPAPTGGPTPGQPVRPGPAS
jgi:hypothetical protein